MCNSAKTSGVELRGREAGSLGGQDGSNGTLEEQEDPRTRESMQGSGIALHDMVNTAWNLLSGRDRLQKHVGTVKTSEQLSGAMVLSAFITRCQRGADQSREQVSYCASGQGVRPSKETLGAVPRHPVNPFRPQGRRGDTTFVRGSARRHRKLLDSLERFDDRAHGHVLLIAGCYMLRVGGGRGRIKTVGRC